MKNPINYPKILEELKLEIESLDDQGKVASYIPELGNVHPKKMGLHLTTTEGQHYCFGDADEKFSIQSISKVFLLTMALCNKGEAVWQRVGVEPSGSAFNSLVQLEYERGIPRNPLINPGAIVVCDILVSVLENPKADILSFIRRLSGNPEINFSEKVADSEKRTGFRNHALINLMKDFGNIHNDIDTVLDLYFHTCSIEMSCAELAQAFLFLAFNGMNPLTQKMVASPMRTKRINAIMLMCGFYDEAGEFAFRAGLPGKSGVGGGIAAVNPGEYSIAVWSPPLNPKGNSYKGMKILELLTTKTQSSIF